MVRPADVGDDMPRVLLKIGHKTVDRAEDLDAALELVVRDSAKGHQGVDDVDARSQILFDARIHAYLEKDGKQARDHGVRGKLEVELDDVLEEREELGKVLIFAC